MRTFIPYTKPYIDESDIEEVKRVLQSGWLTQGPYIEKFERRFAEQIGVRYAVAFSSGTAALHGAYSAAGIEAGDRVLVPPITFVATANAVCYLGGIPVFIDVEPDTGNIDMNQVEDCLRSENIKAVVGVHYGGHPVDLKRIAQLAKEKGVLVIEDACHALGAQYENEKIGNCTYSDLAVFSFHPTKHITTGEGGIVTTNNEKYYKHLIRFRNHGIRKEGFEYAIPGPWHYEVVQLGYNYRLSDIQAALGYSQLRRLPTIVKLRREKAAYYNAHFQNNPYFSTPIEKTYAMHSYHLYSIRLREELVQYKAELMEALKMKQIGTQVHFIPVYWHPFYQKKGYQKGICPHAEAFFRSELSLPLFPSLTQEEQDYVIETLLLLLGKY